MATHPIIDRLAEIGCEELTARQVAYVLNRTQAYVYGLIASNKLEAHADSARTGHGNYVGGTRLSYTITAAAVISYLIQATSGNRYVLLDAIKQRMPQHSKLAKHIALKSPSPIVEEIPTIAPHRKHGVKVITAEKTQAREVQLPLF
jgi:hypothetical protein